MLAEFSFVEWGRHPAPFLPITVSPLTGFLSRTVDAQLDTGADRSLIPSALAAELDLDQVGVVEIEAADGFVTELPTFRVFVVIEPFDAEYVTVAASEHEEYALLGRDISNKFRILLDGPAGVVRIEQE